MNDSTRKTGVPETPDDPTSGDPAPSDPQGVGEAGSRGNGESASAPDDLEQLRKERDEFRDQALRSRAEFANYQKRAKQQADADRAYAVGSLARDLLDSLDNLSRAIDALRASGATDVTAGLDMVQKQLHEVLAKHGVEPIPALGGMFDPNFHDAVLQQPSKEHPEGTVVGELTKGYKIRDRVLRPSKVAVSVRPPSS
jgi:molecular chaperone GrpE